MKSFALIILSAFLVTPAWSQDRTSLPLPDQDTNRGHSEKDFPKDKSNPPGHYLNQEAVSTFGYWLEGAVEDGNTIEAQVILEQLQEARFFLKGEVRKDTKVYRKDPAWEKGESTATVVVGPLRIQGSDDLCKARIRYVDVQDVGFITVRLEEIPVERELEIHDDGEKPVLIRVLKDGDPIVLYRDEASTGFKPVLQSVDDSQDYVPSDWPSDASYPPND